jgi:hypothetical protein
LKYNPEMSIGTFIDSSPEVSGDSLPRVPASRNVQEANTHWVFASRSVQEANTRWVFASRSVQEANTRWVFASRSVQEANTRWVFASRSVQGANTRWVFASRSVQGANTRWVFTSRSVQGANTRWVLAFFRKGINQCAIGHSGISTRERVLPNHFGTCIHPVSDVFLVFACMTLRVWRVWDIA